MAVEEGEEQLAVVAEPRDAALAAAAAAASVKFKLLAAKVINSPETPMGAFIIIVKTQMENSSCHPMDTHFVTTVEYLHINVKTVQSRWGIEKRGIIVVIIRIGVQ